MYEFSVVCIGIICVIEIARFIKDFDVAGKIKKACKRKHNCKDCKANCSEQGEEWHVCGEEYQEQEIKEND